ncbi:MAG: thioredoxin [Paludibacteraceae bacterium]|nr:thioredoxin [Paludibacteraceae bacterium]
MRNVLRTHQRTFFIYWKTLISLFTFNTKKNNMETFQQIINGEKPVLIDFYATWCGPCKAMSPIVEQIGKEMQGQARVLKIDVDKNQAVASQYQIQAVPTFMIFKKGQMVWRQPGGADKMTIMNQLRKFI